MDNISPLAKTLAEANGIDWRSIQGTGDGGQVTEQDIIGYLTRLMTGDEAIPDNPVDTPPPDWTGDELPPGMSADMLSQAGVESDIAQAVASGSFKPDFAQPTAASTTHVEADEFELDAPAVATPEPIRPEPEGLEPEKPEPLQPSAPAAAASVGASAGLGGLLSQLYKPSAVNEPEPVHTAPVQTAPVQPEPMPEPKQPEPDPVQSAPVQPEPVMAHTEPAIAEPAADTVRLETPRLEPQPEDVAPASVQPEPTQPVQPEPVQPEPVQPAVSAPAAHTSAPVGAPDKAAVFMGVYLRRNADLSAASELREQLNTALGQDVPLSLLVGRAAQHHIGKLGMQGVAIHDAYGDRARSIGEAGSSLREALRAIDRDFDGTPDVQIVNAGTFEMDELHYPEAVTLSVGRIDSEGRAALSLNGDLDTARAAEFLAAVAESLEQPVALII